MSKSGISPKLATENGNSETRLMEGVGSIPPSTSRYANSVMPPAAHTSRVPNSVEVSSKLRQRVTIPTVDLKTRAQGHDHAATTRNADLPSEKAHAWRLSVKKTEPSVETSRSDSKEGSSTTKRNNRLVTHQHKHSIAETTVLTPVLG